MAGDRGKRTHGRLRLPIMGTIPSASAEYNRQYQVVIDPTYQWHTFYGSAGGNDLGYGIAVDTSGNVYVTGDSNATWNGPGSTAPLNAYSGSDDIFVLKHAVPITATNVSVPTMSEWGMIAFMLLAGLGSIYYMRRRRA